MKSALALGEDSYELFEDDNEERIDNDAEFDWETGDFDAELTEFEGDEEVRGRDGRRRAPRFRGRPTRLARPPRLLRRRPRRATRRISRGLAFPRRRLWTVGYPPEETLQGTEYVRWLQDSLNRVLGLRLAVNGILGPETRSAVRRFQERERLPVTGIVGPDTERALIAALARGAEPAAPARTAPAEPAEPEPSEGELDDLEFAEDSGEWGEEVADFLPQEEVRRGGAVRGRTPRFRGRPTRFSRPGRRPLGGRWRRRRWPGGVIYPVETVGYPPETPQGTEYVRWVQNSLNRVLGLRLAVNGILGPETRSAVCRFQERERLPVTGIVGPDTERALIAALARGAEPAEPAEPAAPAAPESSEGELTDLELETGADRGHPDYVRWVQQSLNRIMGLRLVADGRIGPQTRSAIRAFQQRRGLRADGVVGAQTERALLAAGAKRQPSRVPTSRPRTPPPPAAPTGRRCRFRFTPVGVEVRGGGRIRDKAPPRRTDVIEVKGVGGRRVYLHQLAAQAWRALVEAARSDGIARPLLLPTSGFRDPERQRRLWEDAVRRYGSAEEARKWVAPPGTSAHQSGRAIDFHLGGANDSRNVANLRRLPAYRWLVENAVCFGFYPYEREPWHWEYNPPRTPSQEFEMAEASMAEQASTYPERTGSC